MNANWVPMKWPCGPVELSRLAKSKSGITRRNEMMVHAWVLPSSLRLLKGSPVNCLVVEWATGTAEDAAQQSALKPLIYAGRNQGISFVGKISAKANVAEAVAAGKASGLDAVMLDAPASQAVDLPVILQFASDSMDWAAVSAIFSTSGNAWPGVQLPTMKGDKASSGPTAAPWVNSNGWFSMLARKMTSGKSLWLDIDPPESSTAIPEEDYCLAIADSRAYGGRWIVSLDARMRGALMSGDQQAVGAWKHMNETLAFYENHSEWETYRPLGALAVVSDFSGGNAFLSGETLHLLNRQQVQFVIMDRQRAFQGPVEGVKGVLWMDDEAPSPEQHKQLLAFVQQGGLIIAGKYWGPSGATPHKLDWLFGYEVYDVGKGRIAVADGGFSDPYQLAGDAHLLVSRSNDVARLYNVGTTNCYASIAPDGKKQVVQILNYSTRVADYLTLWVNTKAKAGQLLGPRLQAPTPMSCIPASDGTNFDLPPLFVTCAVEFERLV